MKAGCSNRPPRIFPFWRRFAPKFEWRNPLGNPGCPFLYRWVLGFGLFSIRLHHWISSDDDRHFHDHPWWFVTLVLSGAYQDVSPERSEWLRRGDIVFRPSLHRHYVLIGPEGCWTLLLTGPELRYWGFWVRAENSGKRTSIFWNTATIHV